MSFDLEETKHGFRWGPLHVSRSLSDPKYGVEIMVSNSADAWGKGGKRVFIRVSPQGRVVEVVVGGKAAKEQ